jgi:two-component system phosphate regulon sensor histidine kinase PhoR
VTAAAEATAERLLAAALRENEELRAELERQRAEREHELLERSRAQEALAAAKWLLEAKNETLKGLDRVKDAFVANVAHELRTPLTSIKGYVEFLQESQLDEDQAQFAGAIERNADRLLTLIEDLLSSAELQNGAFELRLDRVDLGSVVCECVADIRSRVAAKGLGLTVDAPEGIVVRGDAKRLAQVVLNLLANAIKFTPEHGEVSARVAREGDRAVVEVADTGCGIAAADQARLFERFFRSPNVAAVAGSGLGLSIAKAVVEAHGGDILVESRLGFGSTFRVEIPLDDR